jgi:hypothetical protein
MRLGLLLAAALASGCGSSVAAGISGGTSASACGSCHTTEYSAWSSSRLASSGASPVFAALSARVATAWGEDARSRCVTCHEPGFGGDHGIGCVSCHSATGNLATRDGLLSVDPSGPVSGPFADPLATPAHGSRTYGFLESPELCGTCHELTGPRLFHETTLSEFDASGVVASGASCATCHMPEIESGPIALGETQARVRKDHSFVGVDPPWGATPDVAARAASRTLALLRAGIGLTATRAGAGLDIALVNRAGHAVPTGIVFLRGVWVDVELTGSDGKTVELSAIVDLGSQPTSNGMPVALVTEADAVKSRGLAPGETRTVHVEPPSTLAPPFHAVVTLRARAVRSDVLDALGLGERAIEVPTHEVLVVRVP